MELAGLEDPHATTPKMRTPHGRKPQTPRARTPRGWTAARAIAWKRSARSSDLIRSLIADLRREHNATLDPRTSEPVQYNVPRHRPWPP
jgi:hypothetical protein